MCGRVAEVALTKEESVNERWRGCWVLALDNFFKLPVRRCTFSAEVLDDEHDPQLYVCIVFSGGVYWFRFGLPCFNGWRLAVSFIGLMYDGVWEDKEDG
ncbi:hypothetical protein YC2023_042813 [Brassica napus]